MPHEPTVARPDAAQLPLELAWRPAMGAQDLLVAPANEAAVAWVDRWPAWPGPALVVHGPPGCGKTHLIRVWRARTGASEISGAALMPDVVPHLLGTGWAVAVDDADAVAGRPERERAWLHLYNLAREQQASVLLAARTPASRWGLGLPDLASRLNAAPSVGIERPDDAHLEALLFKLFGDCGLIVGVDVVAHLIRRMERSFEAARDVVHALDRAALAGRQGVTLALVRRVFPDGPDQRSGTSRGGGPV